MSCSYRRYEILFPLRLKDGQSVPEGLVEETLLEVRLRFEAAGKVYRDGRGRMFVDVPDTTENRQFFAEFKERIKARFQQIDIWMTTFPVEVI